MDVDIISEIKEILNKEQERELILYLPYRMIYKNKKIKTKVGGKRYRSQKVRIKGFEMYRPFPGKFS